jgi:hypothetical protein
MAKESRRAGEHRKKALMGDEFRFVFFAFYSANQSPLKSKIAYQSMFSAPDCSSSDD